MSSCLRFLVIKDGLTREKQKLINIYLGRMSYSPRTPKLPSYIMSSVKIKERYWGGGEKRPVMGGHQEKHGKRGNVCFIDLNQYLLSPVRFQVI